MDGNITSEAVKAAVEDLLNNEEPAGWKTQLRRAGAALKIEVIWMKKRRYGK